MVGYRNTKKSGRSLYEPRNGKKYSRKQVYMMYGGDGTEIDGEGNPIEGNPIEGNPIKSTSPSATVEGTPVTDTNSQVEDKTTESMEDTPTKSVLTDEEKEKAGIPTGPIQALTKSASEEIQGASDYFFGQKEDDGEEKKETEEGESEEDLPPADIAIPVSSEQSNELSDVDSIQELKDQIQELQSEINEKNQTIETQHEKIEAQHTKYETLLEKLAGVSVESNNLPFVPEPYNTPASDVDEDSNVFSQQNNMHQPLEDDVSQEGPSLVDESENPDLPTQDETTSMPTQAETTSMPTQAETTSMPTQAETTSMPTQTPVLGTTTIPHQTPSEIVGGKSKRRRRTIRKSRKHKYKYRYVY
jgi:hypothetical protein